MKLIMLAASPSTGAEYDDKIQTDKPKENPRQQANKIKIITRLDSSNYTKEEREQSNCVMFTEFYHYIYIYIYK